MARQPAAEMGGLRFRLQLPAASTWFRVPGLGFREPQPSVLFFLMT